VQADGLVPALAGLLLRQVLGDVAWAFHGCAWLVGSYDHVALWDGVCRGVRAVHDFPADARRRVVARDLAMQLAPTCRCPAWPAR